jgi:glutamate synthase (NADPH) large chain
MTGGVVYLKLDEVMGLDEAALRRRLAKGAEVSIEAVGREDEQNLKELLGKYINALDAHEQKQEAEAVRRLLNDWQTSFVKAVPRKK